MKYLLRILFTTNCWIRNNRTNKSLSKFIEDTLNTGELPVIDDNGYTIKLANRELWIENYPYSYGWNYMCSRINQTLPSRRVVFMLHDAVKKTQHINEINEYSIVKLLNRRLL